MCPEKVKAPGGIGLGFARIRLAAVNLSAFVVLVSALTPCLEVVAQEAMDGPGAAGAKTDEAASREIFQALQGLRAAVRVEKKGEKAASPLPSRPQRKVIPPTLTPAELDRLLEQYLAKTNPKVEPAPLTSDVEFVRRVYLDLTGVPPTPEQVVVVRDDRGKDKRARLIDELLAEPGVRPELGPLLARRDPVPRDQPEPAPGPVRRARGLAGRAVREERRPGTRSPRRLITATGRNDENGAVSFALAHEAKPVEMAGEVSRIFLGVQIQCAQCHDHPTDSLEARAVPRVRRLLRRGAGPGRSSGACRGSLPVFEVVAQGRPRYTMPDKDDPTKQIPVAPRFFLARRGTEPALPESLPTRRAAGAGRLVRHRPGQPLVRPGVRQPDLVRPDGRGVLQPGRRPRPGADAQGPRGARALADEWQKGGYDVRWLFRTILNTTGLPAAGPVDGQPGRQDAVRRELPEPAPLRPDPRGPDRGPGTARGPGPGRQGQGRGAVAGRHGRDEAGTSKAQGRGRGRGAGRRPRAGEGPGQGSSALGGPRVLFNALFGVDPSIPNDDVLGTIPQALFLMNSPLIHNRTQARPGTVLGEILATAPDNRAALDALYLRVLARQPTAKEVETCAAYLAKVGNRAEAFEDIFWA